MEWFDTGEVNQLDVISILDLDSVPGLGDDFVGALVLWKERWFNSLNLDVDPLQIRDRSRRWRISSRLNRDPGLQLAESVNQLLPIKLRNV